MSILPQTQLEPLTNELSAEELTIFEPLSNVIAWTSRVNWHENESRSSGAWSYGVDFCCDGKRNGNWKN